MRKIAENSIIYGGLVVAVIGIVISAYVIIHTLDFGSDTGKPAQQRIMNTAQGTTIFTAFDRAKAVEFMDNNHDGMCDFCGMRIEDCITSGMMECTMDSHATIGLFGSQHIHTDFRLYLNGKQINLADPYYFVRSKFVHVENDGTEKTGSVLHVHATGISIGFFLESIGIKQDNLKVYVNGQLSGQGLAYVPMDGDKILITDSTDAAMINNQLDTVTNYIKKEIM